MHVRIRFDGAVSRRWHLELLRRLAARDVGLITADDRPAAGAFPPNAERLFVVERVLQGLAKTGPAGSVEKAAFAPFRPETSPPTDLVIDLCGDVPPQGCLVWRLTFDGIAGERGLLASLLAGRAPVATLCDPDGRAVATGRIGTEAGCVALASFEDALCRVTTLIVAALEGAGSASLPAILDEAPLASPEESFGLVEIARRSAKVLARAQLKRLYHALYNAPHWRVGWRRLAGPDLVTLRRHPDEGWIDLPDDGARFYADPVPIERNGVVTLFVEEFIHSLGRGVISAVAFGPDGPVGVPEPVLDLDYHLSYPFVFEEDGEVWMIPESCAAGRIDLFRATAFPRGWVLDRTLVWDIVASDATIHRVAGRWWMFATVRDGGGAYSDSLHLWSAPDFRGPWTAHARNPVLIDIASARPAGRLVERDGALIRPVQDCRAGYGAAMGLARVLRLDDEGFEQVVETVLRPGPRWPGRRLHTLNQAGGYEFIDGSAEARKPLRRLWNRDCSSYIDPVRGRHDPIGVSMATSVDIDTLKAWPRDAAQ